MENKKKVFRKLWKEEDMEKAILAVRKKELGLKHAAETFKVPRTTLQRYIKCVWNPYNSSIIKAGRTPVFEGTLEQKFLENALKVKEKLRGLSKHDVTLMAQTFARKHNFFDKFELSTTKGKRWVERFLKRHNHLLLTQNKSEYNEENIMDFTNNLEQLYKKHQFPPDRIFTVEVIGLAILKDLHPFQVVECKNNKDVISLSSTERKSLITVVLSTNVIGSFVPPMLIFSEKTMKKELLNGSPSGSIGAVHPLGWIGSQLFTQWFSHFISKVEPSETSPVLLLLDSQYSHTRNMEMLNLAEEHHVEIVSVLSSISDEMQPLTKSVIQPLKELYIEEVEIWNKANKKRPTIIDIAELFGKAYLKIKRENVVNGFRSTGIYPLDKKILLNSASKTRLKNKVKENKNNVDYSLSSKVSNLESLPGPSKIKIVNYLPKDTTSNSTRLPVTEVWLETPSDIEVGVIKEEPSTYLDYDTLLIDNCDIKEEEFMQ